MEIDLLTIDEQCTALCAHVYLGQCPIDLNFIIISKRIFTDCGWKKS